MTPNTTKYFLKTTKYGESSDIRRYTSIWLIKLPADLHIKQKEASKIIFDNMSAFAMTKTQVFVEELSILMPNITTFGNL